MRQLDLLVFGLAFTTLAQSCKSKEKESPLPDPGKVILNSASVGAYNLDLQDPTANEQAPQDSTLHVAFSSALDTALSKAAFALATVEGTAVPASVRFTPDATTAVLTTSSKPVEGQGYRLTVASSLKGKQKETFAGATIGFKTAITPIRLDSLTVNGRRVALGNLVRNVGSSGAQFKLYFSKPLKAATVTTANLSIAGPVAAPVSVSLSADAKVLTASTSASFPSLRRFEFRMSDQVVGKLNETIGAIRVPFLTPLDTTDKFPRISDEELLTLVQKQTFKYFWDAADPSSGLAQERNASPDIVTTGGSGFGIMTLIVGVDRGFITRTQAIQRWDKMTRWLKKADRFHGAWPHWMYGSTGRVRPFSPNDDGGDLVETAFMAQGLMTVRQFLNRSNSDESQVAARIDSLLDGIEWDWYRRGGQDVLYWHWSPRVAWAMNFPLRGWNETLITYVMAAASRTHSIPRSVYSNGFCSSDRYLNGRSYYGIRLPLGPDGGKGGPLFFAHYSFLGLNPTNLRDANAQYFQQNLAHTQIDYQYCLANPRGYPYYGPDCWGLTASDNNQGYSAHDPDNDLGVITPTAALGCMPYTPTESMRALRFFYYKLGDRLWGPQGFYDAFNLSADWTANSYLAIDQGPIIVMIENYRTQRLWNLFMSSPEVQQGLTNLGFTY